MSRESREGKGSGKGRPDQEEADAETRSRHGPRDDAVEEPGERVGREVRRDVGEGVGVESLGLPGPVEEVHDVVRDDLQAVEARPDRGEAAGRQVRRKVRRGELAPEDEARHEALADEDPAEVGLHPRAHEARWDVVRPGERGVAEEEPRDETRERGRGQEAAEGRVPATLDEAALRFEVVEGEEARRRPRAEKTREPPGGVEVPLPAAAVEDSSRDVAPARREEARDRTREARDERLENVEPFLRVGGSKAEEADVLLERKGPDRGGLQVEEGALRGVDVDCDDASRAEREEVERPCPAPGHAEDGVVRARHERRGFGPPVLVDGGVAEGGASHASASSARFDVPVDEPEASRGERCEAIVVRGDEDGDAPLPRERDEALGHGESRAAIEVPGRLVGEDECGAVDERAGDGGALLLAA